ncbi:MAG TPA: gamma-glutamyltransferase [Stellaceae bacterium]|nr:gamma-glutamyltransferase [Stellaceae bacterium]
MATSAVSTRGVVAAGHPDEVAAGLAMLEGGGNAIDAVVAAAFAGYVVEPAMCGIGGYGRMSAYVAERRELISVDHYLRAPGAARADMYEIDEAKGLKYYETPYTKGLKAERGPLAVGVPGAVAGLYWAQRTLGRLPWAAVLEPAVALARAGLEVTWPLMLKLSENLEAIREIPALAAMFLPGGRLPRAAGQIEAAERLPMDELAATLTRIAQEGAAGFYSGPVAEAIAAACRAGGGILSREDLATYRPRTLRERPRRYRGLEYVTCGDPVGYEALNILEHFDLAALRPDALEFRHLMAEALATAFVDNIAHYGDPDVVGDVPAAALSGAALGARRAAMLDPERALPRPVAAIDPGIADDPGIAERLAADPWPPKLAGTTQMTAADREGNMVSLCTSISASFGSLVAVPGTGIVLNNGMGNFDPRPGRPNSIAPGKMPIFAVPVLVALENGRSVFAAAGAGGYRITTGVLHAFTHWRDFKMPLAEAIAAPRVHCQGKETYVDARIDPAVRDGLAALGHRVVVQADDPGLNAFSRVSAVSLDPATGALHAASGPPWHGSAGGLDAG